MCTICMHPWQLYVVVYPFRSVFVVNLHEIHFNISRNVIILAHELLIVGIVGTDISHSGF